MTLIAGGIGIFRSRHRGPVVRAVPAVPFVPQPSAAELRRDGSPEALRAAAVIEAQEQAGDLPSAPPPGYRPPN